MQKGLLTFLFLLLLPVFAHAQSPVVMQKVQEAVKEQQAAQADADKKKEEAAAPKVSPEQSAALIKLLEDPAARDAFLANLKAMQAATAPATKPEEETPSIKALDAVSKVASDAGKNFSSVVKGFTDLPQASRWFQKQWEDDANRDSWFKLFVDTLICLVAGGMGLLLADLIMFRPRRYLAEVHAPTLPLKMVAFFGYHLLTLLPIIAFAGAAIFTLNYFDIPKKPGAAVMLLLYAFISYQMAAWVLRIIFATRAPRLRFVPLDNESAAYLYVWSARLSGIIIFGYFLSQACLAMSMPSGLVHLLAAFIGLIITLMVVIIVLQNRLNVSLWLRGKTATGEKKPVKETPHGFNFLRGARERLADIWHILAIVYLLVGYLIASLNIEEGFGTLLRATVLTVVTFAVFRFILSGIDQLVARGFALPDELKRQFPHLEDRTNSYLPIFQRVMKAVAWLLGALILLAAWGVDTAAWFGTPLGKKVLISGVTIMLALFIAVVLWEIVNSMVDRYLEGRDSNGKRVERSARMRTLLPLIRYSSHVVIFIVAVLIILSELTVDVTPLLAGAGIIGLAIGFGAQTLVKDVITGLFILLEDQISVGDVVIIGDHSGAIEDISIRTVRLRDGEGRVHAIPFSEVKSIINQTKYFGYIMIEVGVGYNADLRKVMDVMKVTADSLLEDPVFKSMIFEPMEIFGVERFDTSSIAMRGRIKAHPMKQWALKREYLLRLKDAFDAEGIEIPYPTSVQYAKVDHSTGEAFPKHLQQQKREASRIPPDEIPPADEPDEDDPENKTKN